MTVICQSLFLITTKKREFLRGGSPRFWDPPKKRTCGSEDPDWKILVPSLKQEPFPLCSTLTGFSTGACFLTVKWKYFWPKIKYSNQNLKNQSTGLLADKPYFVFF